VGVSRVLTNSTTYTPSGVYDISPNNADMLQLEAFVAGLTAADDQEYTTDGSIYAGAWPTLWRGYELGSFRYSLT
jgi:hypothetical protein